ncbi:hypothetical protein [Pyrodictium delaneyi]|uniref:Uncharacterized protein n=1 Tax=Pyrodictium delaneyi TaxID=1273541 RepID=A0A211YQW2_9CREN|nr:hypothetical protein [Pyrodictium delaneyi]OWJ55435.1 hypothetical protein Pdsh_01115 [Pyrodictium delaneyi]
MTENSLELRGMGPFIPYNLIEKLIRRTGEAIVDVDKEAVSVVERWAAKRGYSIKRLNDYRIRISIVAGAAAKLETVQAKAPARPQAAEEKMFKLVVDEKKWSKEMSEKLANVTYVIETVLRAPILYRGPLAGADFVAALSRKKLVLLRISVDNSDYFIAADNGRVVAAAQLGMPLNPEQVKNVIESLRGRSDVLVTIYDISSIDKKS